jgi:hypothetical protein
VTAHRVPGGDPEGREPDRLALTVGMRAATALVGLVLALMGAGGMLASRLSGDRPGTLPLVAVLVGAFGLALLLVALRGRTFGWLPARHPALLPQIVLAVSGVTLIAIGNGVAAVRRDATGRMIGWGAVALAIVLVVVAVLRRWVPRVGERPRRR